jgi:choline dehydrogenase-like flavoprotein
MNAGATVISRCRVDKLVYQGSEAVELQGSLLDATGRTPTGVRISVKAKRYILSAGAIGTPSILLRSGTEDPHGRVGVRTFVHPVVVSGAEYKDLINASRGAPQSIASHHFYDRGDEVGFLIEAAPLYPGLLATAISGFGAAHRAYMEKLPHIAIQLVLTGDGMHDDVPGGKVELRPDGTPVLDYPIAEKTWRALRFGQKIMARISLASGALAVTTPQDPALVIRTEKDIDKIDGLAYSPVKTPVISAHVMGGAGMSDDPKLGVVRSEDLRHHQITNLHVVDGSVFPTSLGVNPQESIYGLAHLAVTRLVKAWT